MYRIEPEVKNDKKLRWSLPDRVFFACGACHILTYAFLRGHSEAGYRALWIRPVEGFTGNHIVAARENAAFDYHGYSRLDVLLKHLRSKARRWWVGWDYTTQWLPQEVLVGEVKSRQFSGLWLREPGQFLHNALPRAERFLARFPSPCDKQLQEQR